jgi:hypothetical protein
MSDFALSIILGIALAAATGFRVFLPMLIVSGAAYTGHLSLNDSFAWLGTPYALTMLSVAALAEILAYYIPVVDNLLDSLATPAAFVAGTVVSAAVMTDVPPMVKWTAAVMAGGGIAHAGRDGNPQGSLHCLDRWSRQSGHRNCGARRRTADILSGPGSTGRGNCVGHSVFMAGDTLAPSAFSRIAFNEQPKINADRRGLLWDEIVITRSRVRCRCLAKPTRNRIAGWCLLLAQSGHGDRAQQCPLSGE